MTNPRTLLQKAEPQAEMVLPSTVASPYKLKAMARPLAYEQKNALNAICPYFTMFPLEYPLRVLRACRGRASVVMDPFCGRGTTIFAARQLGMRAHGIDTSPVAVAVARAKLAEVNAARVLSLAEKLMQRHALAAIPQSEFFKWAYEPSTLRDICAIRFGLLRLRRDTDDSVILRAAMLGCLHGPTNKSPENLAYFSNQMPRTLSSKPDYSVRYWRAHKLRAPRVKVIDVLRKKLERIEMHHFPKTGALKEIRHGDSRRATSLPTGLRDFSVVVTSPPYYGMRTYVEDQWLRNWFLGGPAHVNYGNEFQLQHTGTDVFAQSLGQVWRNMARTEAEHLDMHIRFGILPSCRVEAKELVQSSLEASGVCWRIISVKPARTASSGKRQANHMTARSSAVIEHDFHVRRI